MQYKHWIQELFGIVFVLFASFASFDKFIGSYIGTNGNGLLSAF